ncbi:MULTISPECIES: amidohydrolase [unclassified Modestobacter]
MNGRVHTVDAQNATTTALLVRAGKVALVGTDDQVRAAAGEAQLVDLGGRTVVPGFIDPHTHLSIAAFDPEYVDCATVPGTPLDDLLDRVRQRALTLPVGQWVMGMQFQAQFVREQRHPSRYELDEAAPDNPVLIVDASCHGGYANSAALRLLGINSHTPQPWGGMIETDAAGEPTGALFEAAINRALSASWDDHAHRDPEKALDMLEAKMRQFIASGITAIGDALVTTRAAALYQRAAEAGKLPCTVHQMHGGDHFFSQQDLRRGDVLDRILTPSGDRLRGGVMKVFADRFFPDGPAVDKVHDGCTRHVGTFFYRNDEIEELAVQAARQNIGITMHAMGNCAIDSVLDAYEQVRRIDSDSVLRIEHAFIAEVRQAERIADLGVDLVVNPGVAYNHGDAFMGLRGPDQQHLKVQPLRSMLDAGVRLSAASDYPCGSFEPGLIMATAVSRRALTGSLIDPEEAITPSEALRMLTIEAAHASGNADQVGSIEVGKRANLAVLDRDVLSCGADDLLGLTVDQTWIDGELVHERAAQPV